MDEAKIKRAIANIMYRASTDREYRERCIADGRAIFSSETGKELPKKVDLRFLENQREDHAIRVDGRDVVFILPDYVGTLTAVEDDDLEMVVGGIDRYIDKYSLNGGISVLIDLLVEVD